LSQLCENTAAVIRGLAARVLDYDGSPDAISRLLQHLVVTFDVNGACFFHLPPFDGYQAWQTASAGTGYAVAEPSSVLLDAAGSVDWDAVISGDGTVQSEGACRWLLIPVVHHGQAIACLGIENPAASGAWPRAIVHLLGTVALMLGEVLDRRKVESRLRREESRRLGDERQQRETLVREVHHRIKNNLQGILGLLRQELGEYPALAGAMENAIGKVRSIAIIHGLQSRGAYGEIYLCEIVEAIVGAVREVLGTSINLGLETNIDPPLKVLPEEAVPLALILNELLTNAIKHAAKGADTVDTRVEFVTHRDRGVIRVDNPAPAERKDFDLASGKGLGTGLELVRSLLPHQGASLDIRYVDGSDRVEARLVLTAPVIMAAGPGDRPPVFGEIKMTV